MTALKVATMNEEIRPAPEVRIVGTTDEHLRELSRTMRDKDRKEIEAFGISSSKGLWISYKRGLMNKTALIDGEVAAIWGVGGTYLGPIGQPFLLTSAAVNKISPLAFTRIYQKEVYEMLKLFPVLVNYVDMNYHEAVRLLQIVGFTLGEPEKIGEGMFRKFTLEKVEVR